MKILYIGSLNDGQTSRERMLVLRDIGYEVVGVNAAPKSSIYQRVIAKIIRIFNLAPGVAKLNAVIKQRVKQERFDLVWVDKGVSVRAETLRWIKRQQPECLLLHLNPDDPFGEFRRGWKVFLKAIPYYDAHFVARTQNVEEFKNMGGRDIYVYDRSFSRHLHHPLSIPHEERSVIGSKVGFIGSFAPARAGMIAYLINNGIPVAVWGDGWKGNQCWDIIKPHYRGRARYGEEYVRVLNSIDIALHFLRHENRDEQDSRTFEIPACGTFMLAERSPKHEQFFRENEEAVFFDTAEELLEKVRYYSANTDEIHSIAAAGYRRCLEDGYDHHNRIKAMLTKVFVEVVT